MDSAGRAQELIRRERLEGLLGKQAVEDVLLAHELFHVTEYRKKDTIYTRMEFALRLTGIPYTPYVLDVLLMYGYDKEAATALYEEIAAFAGDGKGRLICWPQVLI